MERKPKKQQGWEKVADWYDKVTGDAGHFYHQEVIIPKLLACIDRHRVRSILDLASGQGVLERALSPDIHYVGLDISETLISQAEKRKKSANHHFMTADVTDPALHVGKKPFDLATIILAIQDIPHPLAAFVNAHKHLSPQGRLMIVMNHPCFRIPRQSGWEIEEATKTQMRSIKGYMTSFEIPIAVNPGHGKKSHHVTYHHHPLSVYSSYLQKAGFCIELLEEWVSTKTSTGNKAKMENRARKEFPLFLCLTCKKLPTPP